MKRLAALLVGLLAFIFAGTSVAQEQKVHRFKLKTVHENVPVLACKTEDLARAIVDYAEKNGVDGFREVAQMSIAVGECAAGRADVMFTKLVAKGKLDNGMPIAVYEASIYDIVVYVILINALHEGLRDI